MIELGNDNIGSAVCWSQQPDFRFAPIKRSVACRPLAPRRGSGRSYPGARREGGSRSASQALFIAQLALLLLVGRLLGELAQRVGQPSVMGQLIGGLLLGPSLFGLLWPSAQHAIFPTDPVQKSMLDAVSELGVLMLRNTTRADIAPDQAILREAGGGYDLVVLGVSRRPGDVLFFGNTAAAVLERSPTSILFVAS